MRAQKLFKQLQGVAGIRLHQEHEIGVPQQVQPVHRDGHGNQQTHAIQRRLEIRFHLPGGHQQQRVQHQQEMDRKTM